ncbi:MAG: hypothetical protein IJ455_07640 [Agathobacter sp.]|nr:hypothetical protein [Agathobacter sp.]
MKKHSKKLLCIILTIVMTLLSPLSIFASETLSNDEILLQRGYPQIVIDTLDNSQKEYLIAENSVFMGAVIAYLSEDGASTTININEDGSYIMPRGGQISIADLTLSLTYSRDQSYSTLKYIDVTASYNWINLPSERLEDCLTVTWDDTKFKRELNSFRKVDKYNAYWTDPNGNIISYVDQITSDEAGYATQTDCGVSWYADLQLGLGMYVTDLYGYATFRLLPLESTYAGTSEMYFHYVHDESLSSSLTVNIKDKGSISISSNGSFSERTFEDEFSWYPPSNIN